MGLLLQQPETKIISRYGQTLLQSHHRKGSSHMNATYPRPPICKLLGGHYNPSILILEMFVNWRYSLAYVVMKVSKYLKEA